MSTVDVQSSSFLAATVMCWGGLCRLKRDGRAGEEDEGRTESRLSTDDANA